MGRKDDEIASLKAENMSLKQELASSRELYDGVMLDKEQLGKMLETAGTRIDAMTVKIAELQQTVDDLSKKKLLDLSVNVTGVQDIRKTLDDSANLVRERLEVLGIKDDYKILAHPHTLSLTLVR